ncbi:MAG: glycosyltransferase family protein [Bacteroidota bacterium]
MLVAVQGDGRGHMTQALALAPMLRRAGHSVCAAMVSVGERQRPPAFFREGLGAPVVSLVGTTFATSADGRIRTGATVVNAARSWRTISQSLDAYTALLEEHEPDVVVSCFDSLTALHGLWRPAEAPVVAMGHQFMFGHPVYPFAPGQPAQRLAMRAYTRFAGASARTRLALSFYDAPDAHADVLVVPPLLRPEVMRLRGSTSDGSLLVYLMEPAMAADLAAWSDRHPDVEIHCFSAARPHRHSAALTFHALSGEAFLARMAMCRGVVCTAGFETVSEAMWLGKPVCMVPTPGHYEQRCNAVDAAAQGAGIHAPDLARGLDAFLRYLPTHRADTSGFRAWVQSGESRVVAAIEAAAAGLTPRAPRHQGDGAAAGVSDVALRF